MFTLSPVRELYFCYVVLVYSYTYVGILDHLQYTVWLTGADRFFLLHQREKIALGGRGNVKKESWSFVRQIIPCGLCCSQLWV